ncbi:MAG: amidohydrolase [Bacteroidota bacterium]
MRISLIQSELIWEDPEGNRIKFEQDLLPLKGGSDIIVLPEMFTSGFTMHPRAVAEPMDGPSMQWMRKMAVHTGAVVTGSLVIERNGRYLNRMVWMKPDGDYRYYDKRHLFRLAGEEKQYSAGNRRMIFEWRGWRIFPLICYDLRFPVWSRRSTLFDYDLLIYVANWPDRRSSAWKKLIPARAIENQCYVAALNRIGADGNGIPHSGDSIIVDHAGNPITEAPSSKHCVLHAELDIEKLQSFRSDFPFWQDADGFEFK